MIQKTQKEKLYSEISKFVFQAGIVGIITLLLINFIFITGKVPSTSMENSLQKGDTVIGNRVIYKVSSPKRGDIVIFENPDNPSQLLIKRVIGLPGDIVNCINGRLFINGNSFEETYIKEEMTVRNNFYYDIPENSYFLLGDNRNNSVDSRFWDNHFVDKKNIIARADWYF